MLIQYASARIQNKQGLMNQRQNIADYGTLEFQTNQLNPYYEKTAQAQGLMGSGMQNSMTQLGNIGYGLGAAYDASQKMPSNSLSNIPQGTTMGQNAQGNWVSAAPGVLPINTNISGLSGVKATPSIFRTKQYD